MIAAQYKTLDVLTDMPEKNLFYLMEIINLSKEKGFKLVLMKTPTPDMGFATVSNTIKKIAEENDVDFIDFHYNQHREAMGLDYTTDFMDGSHLNLLAGEKLSKYIGKYLKENYDLPDRRGDSRYESWNDTADKYFLRKALETLMELEIVEISLNTDALFSFPVFGLIFVIWILIVFFEPRATRS